MSRRGETGAAAAVREFIGTRKDGFTTKQAVTALSRYPAAAVRYNLARNVKLGTLECYVAEEVSAFARTSVSSRRRYRAPSFAQIRQGFTMTLDLIEAIAKLGAHKKEPEPEQEPELVAA